MFGFGTYRRFSVVDSKDHSWTSPESVKILDRYDGAKLCMILYISIAF